jgi:NAD(P)-dependent dehydrogenase (short-subunit alcohol dehydrogenase family)
MSPVLRTPKQRSEVATGRFGHIDVLVNNAGNFFAGFFEELSPEQVRKQIETLLFGPMNCHSLRSTDHAQAAFGPSAYDLIDRWHCGGMFCTAYAAAKFGIEGWMESLTPEISPFGIRTMLVEPGFFRTDLLTRDSTTYADPAIDDYAERTKETVAAWKSMDGKQGGDPAKLARALVELAGLEIPPARFAAWCRRDTDLRGPKPKIYVAQADAHRALSSSLSHDVRMRVIY